MAGLNKLTWLLVGGLIYLLAGCGGGVAVSQPESAVEPAPAAEVEELVAAEVEAPPAEAEELVEKAASLEAMEEEAGAMEPEIEAETAPEEAEFPAETDAVEASAAAEGMAGAELTAEEDTAMTEPVAETIPSLSPEQMQILNRLDDLGQPPELNNEVWLNSDPLKLANLHGKVVLVEFWTFGCYNCKNVIPSLREWHDEYADEGLVIIGIHTPEFGFEKEIANVEQALVDLDVRYPVAIDNDWATWRAYKKPYGQRFWPTKYFVDKAGNVRHIHIGEGRYDEQEKIIQALLAEPGV